MTETLIDGPIRNGRHTAPDLAPVGHIFVEDKLITPLDIAGVRDLAVRAVLVKMDGELGRSPRQASGSMVFVTAVEGSTSSLGTVINVVAHLAKAAIVNTYASHSKSEPVAISSPFDAVGYVSKVLGLPARDICRAAGIASRTYYSWSKGAVPRLQSQGRLWKLVQLAEDLTETLGSEEAVREWFRLESVRRSQVLKGRWDSLRQDAILGVLEGEREVRSRHHTVQLAAIGGESAGDLGPQAVPSGQLKQIPATGRRVTRQVAPTAAVDPQGVAGE